MVSSEKKLDENRGPESKNNYENGKMNSTEHPSNANSEQKSHPD